MPSRHESSARADYVPALCTHRPSLLPIEWLSEAFGLAQRGGQLPLRAGKFFKLGHLEEVKVVTRSPLVNQRRDHYRSYPSKPIVNLTSCRAVASAGRRGLGRRAPQRAAVPAPVPAGRAKL